MTRRRGQNIPDEGPSEADLERFSDRTQVCPNCKAELYDDVDVCWSCGHALGSSDDFRPPKPWIVYTVAAVLIAIAVFWIIKL